MSSCLATGILPAKALEKHRRYFGELVKAYPGEKRGNADFVSSHNDLNPGNVLFQGDKAWLVDWESAFAADRYVDLAAIANFFATRGARARVHAADLFRIRVKRLPPRASPLTQFGGVS